MDDIAAYLFAAVMFVAGPVLLVAFCLCFREDSREHPIYRSCKQPMKIVEPSMHDIIVRKRA